MAITFYATNNFTGNGTTTVWNINFADGYLFPADVKARYVDTNGNFVDIAVTSVVGNVVTISPAQPNGRVFSIYRDTQKTQPLVDFADGAILNETNLDTMATQAVMVAAEASDLANGLVITSNSALDKANDALTGVGTAQAAASAAQASANSAQASAATAQADAATAVSTANAAVSTANGIASTANTALANSNAAVSTANAASSTANGIAGTANTALTNANTAVSTANTANSNASAAVSTANAAAGAVAGKATAGSNSDITSLNGLTTALSVTQGGTGGNTQATARTGLGLGTASVANIGSSGATVPLLNAGNIWAGTQNFTGAGVTLGLLNAPLGITSGGTGQTNGAAALTALGATGRLKNIITITASGTYTPSAGTNAILVEVCGGGGGGGGSTTGTAGNMSLGGGGCSGAYARQWITSVAASYSVTVGGAGLGVTGSNGLAGGNSAFAAICSAIGGGPGGTVASGSTPAIAVGNIVGLPHTTGGNVFSAICDRGIYGVRLSGTSGISGGGGSTQLGTGAWYAGGTPSGTTGYGSGGAGSLTNGTGSAAAGSDGAPGVIIVWEFT